MRNEHIPEHCDPIMERRNGERINLRNAALLQASVDSMAMDEFYLFGQISEETKDQQNEAGKRYNEAIRGMLGNNSELRQATT